MLRSLGHHCKEPATCPGCIPCPTNVTQRPGKMSTRAMNLQVKVKMDGLTFLTIRFPSPGLEGFFTLFSVDKILQLNCLCQS